MPHLAAVLLGTCVLASSASAQVYRWVDERGRVHYGNSPGSGAIRLGLREPVAAIATRPRPTTAQGRALPAVNATGPREFPGEVDQATVASVGRAILHDDCRRRPAQCSSAGSADGAPRALPSLSALRLP